MTSAFIPGVYVPGCVIAVPVKTEVGIISHKGILSDRSGSDGMPMVVHNAKLFGHIVESSMTDFFARAQGPARSEGYPGRLPPQLVLARARSQITRPWKIWDNCEHLAYWAHGLPRRSPQLRSGAKKAAALVTCLTTLGLLVLVKVP